MKLINSLSCPKCNGNEFIAKHKATYVYSYNINTQDTVSNETLPFSFENRERTESTQYIECKQCGATFSCNFELNPDQFDFTIIQKAIRSEHTTKPEFLG